MSDSVLAALFRASHVGFVTPLRDGMNLVAKEYVSAQDPDDPGVLVLSQFAGAAQELNGALIVNPLDIDGMADALATALAMPLGERQARYREMFAAAREQCVRVAGQFHARSAGTGAKQREARRTAGSGRQAAVRVCDWHRRDHGDAVARQPFEASEPKTPL